MIEQAIIRQEETAAFAAILSSGSVQGLKELVPDEGEDPAIPSISKRVPDSMRSWLKDSPGSRKKRDQSLHNDDARHGRVNRAMIRVCSRLGERKFVGGT